MNDVIKYLIFEFLVKYPNARAGVAASVVNDFDYKLIDSVLNEIDTSTFFKNEHEEIIETIILMYRIKSVLHANFFVERALDLTTLEKQNIG